MTVLPIQDRFSALAVLLAVLAGLFALASSPVGQRLIRVAPLLIVAAAWIGFHAIVLLALQRLQKAPTFFMAVGSQANFGGAASAPIVASAFHPALVPVGALLGVAGYVVGTYAGRACAFLLEILYQLH